jgi:CRP/FNR family cyclic AMP-dependent transcriptional regulator
LQSTVHLLERDPDLGGDLDGDTFALASRRLIARTKRYPQGPWEVRSTDYKAPGSLGLLLLDGLLVRKVTVGERTCAELLGPGDVTQPWLQIGPDSSVGTEVNWQVAQSMQVAVLDRQFTVRTSPWPEITAAIAGRVMLRVHWLSFHLSVCHMRRVDDRLLLVLWHFADRWGRVTPRGVEIPLSLTHSLLAYVVGSHRPTVTLALRTLTEAGLVERRSRSHWLLRGDPPAELRQVHEHAARHDRELPSERADRDSEADSLEGEGILARRQRASAGG